MRRGAIYSDDVRVRAGQDHRCPCAERWPTYVQWLRSECYSESGHKRVPRVVLNGDEAVWRAFLCGYNQTDGLKAGNGSYKYKNFKTNSPVLAMGLWWMAKRALGQDCVLTSTSDRRNGRDLLFH